MIKIVYCGNEKFFDGLYLSILSIVRRFNKEGIEFYLITGDFTEIKPTYLKMSDEHCQIIKKMIAQYNSKNTFTLIDSRPIYDKHLKGNKNEKTHYSPYSCLRLLLDCYDYFTGKVIYLDIDTMICGNIKELYDVDLADNEFAVAHDCLGRIWQHRDCFNAGVMLFNMDLCRKNNLFKKAREYLFKKIMYFPDQSALNLATSKFMFFPGNEYRFNQQKIKIMPDTVVKHFCARVKWWPLHNNIKQWDIKNVHRYLRIHAFDEDFSIYLKMKNQNNF